MKQRIISALFGLLLLAVVIFFFDTILLNIAIAVISLIAVHELLNVFGLNRNVFYNLFAAVYTILFSFSNYIKIPTVYVVAVGIMVFFVTNLILHEKYNFEFLVTSFVICITIPFFFSRTIYFRDTFGHFVGLYLVVVALGSAWFCDTCAYFSGVFFGKHKLAPKISPKKTIEGAVGGIIGSVLLSLATAYIFEYVDKGIIIEKIPLLIIAISLSLVGILGDLTASVIKRQHNVKDYGHIMPGHGGIMDRFDSVLMILPSLAFIVSFYNFVSYLP